MMTHSPAQSAAPKLQPSLTDAARRADRRLVQAAQASERVHRQVERAIAQRTSPDPETLRERRWPGRAEPWVGRLSSGAQALARHSLDLAANAGSKAQASWTHYAQATNAYVAREPVRSVLIAAAVGAGLALLAAASRKRD